MSFIRCDLTDCANNFKGKCHANKVRLELNGNSDCKCKTYRLPITMVYTKEQIQEMKDKEAKETAELLKCKMLEYMAIQEGQKNDTD